MSLIGISCGHTRALFGYMYIFWSVFCMYILLPALYLADAPVDSSL
jgi:hypothetical protein